jgi:hypothetical protein
MDIIKGKQRSCRVRGREGGRGVKEEVDEVEEWRRRALRLARLCEGWGFLGDFKAQNF